MGETKKDEKPGYAFRIGAQTEDGISVDITGNFPIGVVDEVANAELDLWINRLTRQRAKAVLAKEEDTLRREQEQLEQMLEQLREMQKKEVMKSAEKQAYEAHKQNILRVENTIKARTSGVESLKKLI